MHRPPSISGSSEWTENTFLKFILFLMKREGVKCNLHHWSYIPHRSESPLFVNVDRLLPLIFDRKESTHWFKAHFIIYGCVTVASSGLVHINIWPECNKYISIIHLHALKACIKNVFEPLCTVNVMVVCESISYYKMCWRINMSGNDEWSDGGDQIRYR